MQKLFGFLWRKKLLMTLLVVFAGGGYWWWSSTQAKEEVVSTVKPEYRDIREVLTVSGSVDASEKAVLKFPAMSQLTWVGVQEGDVVKKYQGIASVDSRTLKKQMEIAQNTHGKVFRGFEQTLDSLDAYAQDGLTDAERRSKENAELDVKNSALQVEIADLAVKLSYMYSPINGLVVKIDQPNIGATILPSDTFVIINPQTIYFSAVVDEEDIGSVIAGQQAVITLDAYRDQEITSTISQIAFTPSQSASGGTGYRIKLELPIDNNSLLYKLGMNGDASILLREQQQALSVPVDAIIERDGQTMVEVWRNNLKEAIPVTLGVSSDDYVAITSGLIPSDDVVIP